MSSSAPRRALAIALFLAFAACGLPDPSGVRGDQGGKPKPRPGTGGSGGQTSAGGAGGFGGDAGSGGDGGALTPMQLDAVRPPRGAREGGETITLQGKGFLQGYGKQASAQTQVRFGSNPALAVRVIDDGTIFVEAPPGLAGAADVVVTNPRAEATCAGCFEYVEPVTIASIDPPYGSSNGGTRVTLRGTGFAEGMILTFGADGHPAVAALDVHLEPDGSLTALSPPGPVGVLADVRIYDEGGMAAARKAFRFVNPLRIDSIVPPGGPTAGGNQVRILGSGYPADAEVWVDGVHAQATLDANGRDLLATMPAHAEAGPVVVEVRTKAEEVRTGRYGYFDPEEAGLRLYAIDPPRYGLFLGEYTIVGSGLDHPRLTVRIGGQLANIVGAPNPWSITVNAPPSSTPGWVDVEARIDDEVARLPDAFLYPAPSRPVVRSFSPTVAPIEGGGRISIMGTGFPLRPRVFVGVREASGVVRVSDRQIDAVVPPGAAGTVAVRVVDGDDTVSEGSLPGFVYRSQLRLARVEPASGARAGGTRVTLRGVGFEAGGLPIVRFGDAVASRLERVDDFTAVFRSPRGDAGLVDVEVSTSTQSSSLRDGFNYFDPSSTLGGSSGGPLNGDLNVAVVEGTWWKFGEPVAGADVIVGSDDGALYGITDDRGEVTLSGPILVKPQVVTVLKGGYESATIVNQRSENLTVRLEDVDGVAPPPEEGPPPPPPPEPGLVRGRVWGFKLPPNRPLRQGEREVAYVDVAARSVYSLPPFGSQPSPIEIAAEGGAFAFRFVGGRKIAIYAFYGIENTITRAFEPLALGVSRGVLTEPGVTTEIQVILDTHLDVTVPVTIDNPPAREDLVTSTRVYAYADLAGEGVVPLGSALTSGAKTSFWTLPDLQGVNLLFAARGGQGLLQVEPYSVTFRRQAGDLRQGLTIGPLLGLTKFVSPDVLLGDDIEWTRSPGPVPALSYLFVETLDRTPVWHAVVPGTETHVPIPWWIRAGFKSWPQLRLTLVQGIEPRLAFDEWSYDVLTTSAFTSFTVDSTLFSP